MRRKNKLLIAAGCAALVVTAMQMNPAEVTAADHGDSPQAMADPAADIADVYAWADAEGERLFVVITFDGNAEAGGTATYDADVLYTVHIDNTGNNQANHNVYVRFGQNLLEEWGVRVDGLPGEAGPFEGPVAETVSGKGGGRVHADVFDDPFFFDFAGFGATLASGTLSFTAADFFAGANASAIVLDMDAAEALGAGGQGQVWVTTGRRPAAR